MGVMSNLIWIAFPIGLAVTLGTFRSMMKTVIVPRGLASSMTAVAGRAVNSVFLAIANRCDDYTTKDRILVMQGPAALLGLLVLWLVLFVAGYTLMLLPLVEGDIAAAFRQGGSAVFTLGFAPPPSSGAAAIHFFGAFTGLIVIALQIAYLPTFYSAFNRRETLVTMLQSRAGSPAWGPEILIRHQIVGLTDTLPTFYADWEEWAADVAESHTNYPVLIYLRSPHALRSWIVALLAVLDAAALQTALNPSSAPTQARLCIRMGFTCLRDIASATGIPHDPDPFPDDPIELTYEEFEGAVARLEKAGFPMERTPEEAWPHFRGWRVNYESVAYAIADRVVAPPGPWSGPRQHLPDVAIVPVRPPDRRPDTSHAEIRPRGSGAGL